MKLSIAALITIIIVDVVSANYNETLARQKFVPLASAAYSSAPERCLKQVFKEDAQLHKAVQGQCGRSSGEKRNCFAFVGVTHADAAIFVVYRGTNDGLQLYYQIQRTIMQAKVKSPVGGRVNKYFYDVYQTLERRGVKKSVAQLAKKYPHYKIWVTGHSLGGALASIAAGELVAVHKINGDRITMLTFGQPRVGDRDVNQLSEFEVPHAYRVINQNDLVPHVPPRAFDGYEHSRTEIWYKSNMSAGSQYIECKEEEAEDCGGARSSPRSLLNHISYFDVVLFGYGMLDCKFTLG